MRTPSLRASLLWSICTLAAASAPSILADVPERRPAQTVHPYPESFPLGDSRPHFGAVVAVRNDTALVGMPSEGGSVAVFTRSPWFWRRTGTLPCPSGACVSVHSITYRDGFAVVGARNTVLIFRKELGEWKLKERILPPEPGLLQFGHKGSVRYRDHVVTATAFAKNDGPGAMYVFELSPTGRVVRTQKLMARDATVHDGFGSSVAMSAHGIIVGAPDAAPKGAVYVFRRIDGQWVQKQTLRPGAVDRPGAFGLAVAIDQGVLLIGAPNADRIGPSAGFEAGGTVYEFAVSNGVWMPRGKFRPSQSEFRSYTDFGRDIVMFDGRAMITATPTPFVSPGQTVAFEYRLAATGNQVISFARRQETQGDMALFNNVFALGAPDSPETGIGHVAVYDLKAPLQLQPFCANVIQGPKTFCDDFESGTAERWRPVDGTWSVVDREYVGRAGADRCNTGFSSNESLIQHLDAADVDVRLQMRSIQRVDKGVILRSTSSGDQIELNFLADPYNALAIQEVSNCELTIYQILVGTPGIRHELGEIVNVRVRLVGRRLQVWMKGQLVLDGSFPFRATRGSVGVSVITDLGYSVFDDARVDVLR